MFHRKNDHTFGILIDFDLAVIVDMPSENQRRTGTRPFMAIELLVTDEPIRRHYKHDAESFFWVVVYNTTSNTSVNGWGLLTNHMVCANKTHYLALGTRSLPMRETFRPISTWVDGVREFLLPSATREKDWGIDELYNTLRGFRHDQGNSLAAHIETRQKKCYAPAAS
jgi:hypothetical protein